MGLLDALRSVFGSRAETDAGRDAHPDDLFGMSTAYITMEAELDHPARDVGALCFGDVDAASFRTAVEEVRSILEAGRAETGTMFSIAEDDHGYRWLVLRDDDVSDLLTSMHFAAETLIDHGYGSRLLAAVFAFEGEAGPIYWVYSFRRGAFYPFVPRDDHDRDTSLELSLAATLDGELAVEDEREHWFPLWPSRSGRHPWE